MSAFETVEVGAFTGRCTLRETEVNVVLVGEADAAALAALERLLGHVHAQAGRRPGTTVIVDLRELVFMNSSCFSKMVAWVNRARELGVDCSYRIRVRTNDECIWQKRSLQALQCFANEIVTLET